MAEPDQEGICAVACCICGKEEFRVVIYGCGYGRPICTHCGKAWPGSVRASWFDNSGDQAMAQARDV